MRTRNVIIAVCIASGLFVCFSLALIVFFAQQLFPIKLSLAERRRMEGLEINYRASEVMSYKQERGRYPQAFAGEFMKQFKGPLTNPFTDKEELPLVKVVDRIPANNKDLVHKLSPGQFEYVVSKDGSAFRLFCADENGEVVREPEKPEEFLVLSGN